MSDRARECAEELCGKSGCPQELIDHITGHTCWNFGFECRAAQVIQRHIDAETAELRERAEAAEAERDEAREVLDWLELNLSRTVADGEHKSLLLCKVISDPGEPPYSLRNLVLRQKALAQPDKEVRS